jgi:hypothetical protein
MHNYLVVLFKNKKKKRIIKKFITLSKAKLFMNKLLDHSNEVIYDVKVENGFECTYEVGIIELSNKQLVPVYITDEMGRNIRVKLDEENMTLFEIHTYKKEEKIFDLQTNTKIKVTDFIKKYLKTTGLKLISSLNNKVIVQNDDETSLFSLKNEGEVFRFFDCLQNFMIQKGRKDCLIVKDNSTPQRKYLIKLLTEKGFDKKILYNFFEEIINITIDSSFDTERKIDISSLKFFIKI